jgi:DNA-binding transcriptional regulator YdaS (Cro superfamily)
MLKINTVDFPAAARKAGFHPSSLSQWIKYRGSSGSVSV